MDASLIGALAATVATVVTAFFTWRINSKKTTGELTLSEREAFNQEQVDFRDELRRDLKQLREEVDALRRRVRTQQGMIDALEEEIAQYRRQLREAGLPLPTRVRYWIEEDANDHERTKNNSSPGSGSPDTGSGSARP